MKDSGRPSQVTFKRWCWLAAAVATLSPSDRSMVWENTAGAAEAKAAGRGNFLVVPTTTELQRYYFRNYESVNAFMFVNAMDPVSENGTVLDAAAIDFDALRKALSPYAASEPPGRVVFAIRARREPPKWPAARLLSRALGQLGREVGLRDSASDIRLYSEFGPPGSKYFNNWRGLVSDLAKPATNLQIEAEAGMGDDQVRVFAAHTPLSRLLYGGEDGHPPDCVVFIIPPIEQADVGSILATMQRSVSKLKFVKKHRLLFKFHTKNRHSAETALKEFTGAHVWRNLLGFETYAQGFWNPPAMQFLRACRQGEQARTGD